MKTSGHTPLTIARALILLHLVALCVSTAAASVSEVLIYLVFLGFRPLRIRTLGVLRQPMVLMTLVLWAMVGLGTLYSSAPFAEAMDMWGSWRKCLLIPLTAAVYDDSAWKNRLLWIFIGAMTLAAVISFAGHLLSFTVHPKMVEGIVVANHATQSMFFATASFACLTLVIFTPYRSNPLIWIALIIITGNLLFITWGRSGYLAFMVFMTLLALWGARGRLRLLLAGLIPVSISLLLLLSPIANDTIQQGLNEMQTYKSDTDVSSMGLRMVFWKNTLKILQKMEHPVIGYGTDGFKMAYREEVKNVEGWQGVESSDPHNQFLKILVEYGGLGLVIFLLFIASFLRQKVVSPYHYLGMGVVLAWCATSMFSGHFSTFHEGRFFFLWCGAMLAHEGTGMIDRAGAGAS